VNKAQLIEAVASHYDGSKAEATKALNAVVQTITQQTAAGEKVSITGFGVFERVPRPARMVRNPRTGERKRAKATAVPRFRAGSELKAYVSGERKLPKAAAKKTSAKAAATKTSAKPAQSKTADSPTPAKTAAARKATPAAAAPTARSSTAKTAGSAPTRAQGSPTKQTTPRKTTTRKTAKA
jgi:DNA-binding protein HU-beta